MIAVFDSGIGGLGALSALRQLLPYHDLCYFADTAHLPYGKRRPEEIRAYLERAVRALASRGVKHLLIACGTASSLCGRMITPISVSDIIFPAAWEARGERIAILATERTVREDFFRRAVAILHPRANICTVACPTLVTLAEAGCVSTQDARVQAAIRAYLAPLLASPPDTVVLGCTHFPRFRAAIQAFLPSARLIDSGHLAAEALARRISPIAPRRPSTHFWVTADAARFNARASVYLSTPVRATQVDPSFDYNLPYIKE